jgi:hypothetical protein
MNCHRSRFRIGLIALIAISLFVCPLSWGGWGLGVTEALGSFVPSIVPLEITRTLEGPELGTLQAPAATVTPFPAPAQESRDALRAPSCVSATEDTIGYDFLGGSDPPLWRICFGGEVLIIGATDSETSDLLSAFRAAADLRAQALAQRHSAETLVGWSLVTLGGGVVAFVGGGVAAIGTCAATPLTLGTTFLACVGSAGAALGGLVATVGSAATIGMALETHDTEQATIDDPTADPEQYFRALQERTSP